MHWFAVGYRRQPLATGYGNFYPTEVSSLRLTASWQCPSPTFPVKWRDKRPSSRAAHHRRFNGQIASIATKHRTIVSRSSEIEIAFSTPRAFDVWQGSLKLCHQTKGTFFTIGSRIPSKSRRSVAV